MAVQRRANHASGDRGRNPDDPAREAGGKRIATGWVHAHVRVMKWLLVRSPTALERAQTLVVEVGAAEIERATTVLARPPDHLREQEVVRAARQRSAVGRAVLVRQVAARAEEYGRGDGPAVLGVDEGDEAMPFVE